MEGRLRKAGIDILGEVPWGTHFCQFYQTREDLLDILLPYFKAGLENNEFCMWVTSQPLSEKEALKAMRKAVADFDRYLDKGQIEILPHTEWYLRGDSFESRRVLSGWVDKLDRAIARGFDGLRLTGNTFWLEKEDWRDFVAYEEEVNNIIGRYPMIAMCTYSFDKCRAAEIIDVVGTHQFALSKRERKWDLIESAEHRRAVEALKESEARYRSLFENLINGFSYHRIITDEAGKPVDYVFVEVNSAFEKLTGLKRRNIIGRSVREVLPGIEHDPADWIGTYGRVALGQKSVHFEQYAELLGKWYSVLSYSPRPGYFATIFEDITDRKLAENEERRVKKELELLVQERTSELIEANRELETEVSERRRAEKELGKVNRALRTLSKCNEALVHATMESEFLDEICRIIIEEGGYLMAWIGYAEQDGEKMVRPVACAGHEDGYLSTVKITWADNEWGRGPTGTAIRTGALRVQNHMLTDANYAPWRHEATRRGYSSSIALPLVSDGRPFGALTVYASERDVFIEEENKLLKELADDVAYGIMTMRMREKHRQSEEELRISHEQLHNLAAHLQSVREEERSHIAREIHDELGQALTALKMDAAWISGNAQKDPKRILEKAVNMSDFIDATIQTTKRICSELRPSILDHLGIASAIEWQMEEVQRRTGLACAVSFDPEEISLKGDLATMVFRVFQEALTNVVRHAEATRAAVNLRQGDAAITLTIIDNGKGMTEDQMAKPNSFGLLGIQERVRSFGGEVKIEGVPGEGTLLQVTVPLARLNGFQ